MELAVPIFCEDKVYDVIEIKKPKTGVITATYEAMQKGNIFRAMLEFVSGSVLSLISIEGDVVDEFAKIKKLCGAMPYITAEAVALKIMCEVNEEDSVEGMYNCPRCNTKILIELDKETGIDSRDKISELEVKIMEPSMYVNSIPVLLSEAVVLKNTKTGEVLETIEEFAIRYPTLNDCILAGQNMMEGQEVRVQMKLYSNALISRNGIDIDRKWASTWGDILIKNTGVKDLTQIGKALQEYGLKKTVERSCFNCGKVWEAAINTSNFFVSGLQSV